jgi:hypothetical protein
MASTNQTAAAAPVAVSSVGAGVPARVLDGTETVPRAMRDALLAAVLVGVAVAIAPALPSAVRIPGLVAVLAAWTAAGIAGAVWGTRQAWHRVRSGDGRWWVIVGGAGILVALLDSLELELVRTLLGRPAFLWNWRWTLNHAWAVAQAGGVDQALDYAGAPVNYHVGPAWLAGAVQRLLGGGITHVLFGLVPSLAILTVVIAALVTLRSGGIRYRYGAAATAVAMTIPLSDRAAWDAVYALPGGLLTAHSWPFLATDLMMNSLLGLAVGLASLGLLLSRAKATAVVAAGSVGLSSLVQIKPQFYVAFALLAGIVGLVRLLRVNPLGRRDAGLLVAAAASLPLALASLKLLPGDLPILGSPEWKGAETRGLFVEAFRASTFLAVGALLLWRFGRWVPQLRSETRHGIEALLAACVALFTLAGVFHFVDFPCRPEFVARWLEFGFERSSACFSAVSASSSPTDGLVQSLQPLRLVALLIGFSVLALSAEQVGRRWVAGFTLLAAVIVASPIAVLTLGFIRPNSAFVVAEDPGLFEVLRRIPTSGTLLIASDLADPAQDFRRSLQGMLLTAYRGHAFYAANLRYVHYLRNDAQDRLRALRGFFGAPWSEWHSDWLRYTGVTHVLIDDRCAPPWAAQPGLPLRRLGSSGRWTAFEVPAGDQQISLPPPPAAGPVQPAYGQGFCLWGERGEVAAKR